MSDIPKHVRSLLAPEIAHCLPSVNKLQTAADGTRKLVLQTSDRALVESVLIPMTVAPNNVDHSVDALGDDCGPDDSDIDDSCTTKYRATLCVSTQIGCAMGCSFCASGTRGLYRHLTPSEIVAQVLIAKQTLSPDERLTNVVLMGMGEPLHNYDATVRAVRILQHADGLGLSSRRITISTVGLVPELHRLADDFRGKIGLAISLHAADDAVRTRLVPINKHHKLAALMTELRRYPLPPRRRITIECALVDGVNDSEGNASSLVSVLRGIPAKVNLIPMNPVPHSQMRPSRHERVLAFQRVLHNAGMSCFLRKRRGDDVTGACGQLTGGFGTDTT